MPHAKVRYTHKKKDSKSAPYGTIWTGNVSGQTESAIMAVLQKKHKDSEIVITKIEWK